VPGLFAASALYTLAPFLGIVSLITFSNEVISPAVIVAPGLLTSVLPPGMIVLVGSSPVIAVASTMTALFALPPVASAAPVASAVPMVRLLNSSVGGVVPGVPAGEATRSTPP
jgi:hypothetical protein